MHGDPILARTEYRERVPMVAFAEGGLHYLKGNASPYFSLTMTAHRKGFPNQCWRGGAAHGRIRELFGARFDDLARLHMSDIDGKPMHAVANGWYWLAGALGGAGEAHHGGNGKRQRWKPDGSFDGYRESTPAECLQTFADLWRMSADEAAATLRVVQAAIVDMKALGRGSVKELLAELAANRAPVWKREADDCIKAHSLRVYGDPWPQP